MSRSRDFADLAGSADAGGLTGRNLIINGSGAVDQRGGSSTINAYSVDRWRSYGGPGGFTISQRTDAGEGDGFAIRFQRTSGNTQTDDMGIAQGIETKNSKFLAGKTVTLSFRARVGADWSPINFDAIIYSGEGTDENPVGMTNVKVDTVVDNASLTTSFQTFSGSVVIESDKTQVTVAFLWTPSGTAGSNDYVDIREVQLEVGETATPFEHRSYADELFACQRYYSHAVAATGPAASAGAIQAFATFPRQMRASPSYSVSGALNWSNGYSADVVQSTGQVNVISNNTDGSPAQLLNFGNFSGLTTSQIMFFPRNSTNNNRIIADAEL